MQESLEEYRIKKLEEEVIGLKSSIEDVKIKIQELREMMVESRTRNAILVGAIPTLLSLIIGGLGLWIK
jgi:hypothetical protein